jgi:hypothetical protein
MRTNQGKGECRHSILIFEPPPIYPLLLVDQTNEFAKEGALSTISDLLENQRP